MNATTSTLSLTKILHARQRAVIKATMRAILRSGECIDRKTGIADLTKLAEAAAAEHDADDWLDDSDHEIWELAIEVAEEMGHGEH